MDPWPLYLSPKYFKLKKKCGDILETYHFPYLIIRNFENGGKSMYLSFLTYLNLKCNFWEFDNWEIDIYKQRKRKMGN